MKILQGASLLVLAAGVIGLSMSVFTVEETQQAIVLQLGQPVGDVKGPGLHFKIPVVQTVRSFDRRILSVDPEPEQMVISSRTVTQSKPKNQNEEDNNEEEEGFAVPSIDAVTGEPIIVDSFARYKIVDPLQFLKTLGTTFNANSRLKSILSDATKAVLGKTTLQELLSPERTAVMDEIQARVNKSIANDKLGIEIVDVRIVRADLTPELRQSTVRRMISELRERATETRAVGEEKALEIRSKADKERTVILAEAQRDGQVIRGRGDKTAIKTYADAFNKDVEFYDFIRSMEAYSKTLATPETRLILSPNSQFFKHFKSMQ